MIIGTVTGGNLDYENANASHISLFDIATGLSNVCRFAGQLSHHYSVAAHSVEVCRLVGSVTLDPCIRLQALLHDASEAYTGDIPTPLKMQLGARFQEIEDGIQNAIYRKFRVPTRLHPWVKEADLACLLAERDSLQPEYAPELWQGVPATGGMVAPRPSIFGCDAKVRFLTTFFELTTERLEYERPHNTQASCVSSTTGSQPSGI